MSQKLGFYLVLGGFLIAAQGMAQTTSGTISGTLFDETGAVLPGVTVTVTHLETGEKRTVLSDDAGRYRVPQLALGDYEVKAELSGFKTAVRRGVTLTVRREAIVDVTLNVGEVSEQLVVTGEAPLVETRSSALSGLVDDRAIRDLPLNGRSFDNLITLHAGSVLYGNRERLIGAGPGNYFSVSGLRPAMNRFTLDGTEYNGASAVSTTPGGVSGQTLGIDAIREFEVLRNVYSSEFGKRGGAQVNVVTKSGTNEFHGTAFAFHRNDNLDARNFFDATSDPPEFKRNSYGAFAGGPILKNKTFFFGGYEGFRERLGLTLLGIVPDENARRGLLPDPARPGQFRNVGVAPSVRPFLDALYPLPNGRNFGDGTAEIFSSPKSVVDEDYWTSRMDHNFSESDSLFGRYTFDDGSLVQADTRGGNPWVGLTMVTRAQVLTLEEKHIFSSNLLNVFRFGYNRAKIVSDEGSLIKVPAGLTFIEGREIGRIRIGGGTGRAQSAISDAGNSGTVHNLFIIKNQFTFFDQLNLTRGPHSFKIGTEIQRIQSNEDEVTNRRGEMFFTSLEDFLRAAPSQFAAVEGASAAKSWRHTLVGIFFQDDVRARNNLTLNLGLRYEFLTKLKDSRNGGQSSNFLKAPTSRGSIPLTQPLVGETPFVENNSLRAFGPRVGLAWDPFNDGKTSVRAGFGIFYDQLDNLGFILDANPPFVLSREIPSPPFPRPFEASGVARLATPRGIQQDADIPTVLQYNLTLQREVTRDTVFSAGYVGSRSYHMVRNSTPNTPFPEFLPDGRKFFPVGAPRRNPALATGSAYWLTDANSSYHSLQLEVTKRMSRGIRYKAAYTLGKNLDNAAGKISEEAQGGANQGQDPDDVKSERGLSSWDVTHNFTFNLTYDLPLGPGRAALSDLTGFAEKLLAGWQVSGITNFSTGVPATARVGFNRSRNGITLGPDRPDLLSGASNNPGLGSPVQWFDPTVFLLPQAGTLGNVARNTIRLDGLATVDLSLFKNAAIRSISEDLNLQFRAEFFNLFNHVNFGVPDMLLFSADGTRRGAAGRIRRTVTSSRQIQLGLKIIF